MTKILLIDDDPDVRTVMSGVLKNEGYEVETASCKEEALEKLQTVRPAVILLDVLLCGTDGRELCRQLKEAEPTKNIHIIMFSGHPGAALQFEAYGANDFVAKPVNTALLLQKLASQLTGIK